MPTASPSPLRPLRPLVTGCLAALAAPFLVLAAMAARLFRRPQGAKPRTVWGPIPNLGIIYMSRALAGAGYPSESWVYAGDPLVGAERFDRAFQLFPGSNLVSRHFNAYCCFLTVLFRFDLAMFWLAGGFLLETPWIFGEMRLLRLAGIKTVFMPFGSDIAIAEYLGPVREKSLIYDPSLPARAEAVRRKVDFFCRHGDFIIRNVTTGYVPRCDAFIPNVLAIDIEPPPPYEEGPELVVLHASNHRLLKGTNEVIAAVEDLRAEGLPVRLQLIEKQPNHVVRAALRACDIVADQFVYGYAMFGIEGMAAGKPVMTHLRWMYPEVIAATCYGECPALETGVADIKDNLRRLVLDPALRRRLGQASLAYARKYHSFDAVGAIYAAVVEHVWNGRPLPAGLKPIRTNAPFNLHYPLATPSPVRETALA